MNAPFAGGVVTVKVMVDDVAIPGNYQVHAIMIDKSINRIPTAVLTIVDGNAASENFAVSSSSTFVPGKSLVVEAGYDNRNAKVFSGIITSQSIRAQLGSGPLLDVECRDQALAMAIGRKSAAWSETRDSTVISNLIAAANLDAEVEQTQVQLAELVQYYVSDWDFVVARAEVNGLLVAAYDGKVKVLDPRKRTTSVLTAQFGDPGVLAFSADLNAVTQLGRVTATSWNYPSQAKNSSFTTNTEAGPGNLSSKKLSEVVGPSDFALQTTTAEPQEVLSAWAKAQMLKSQLSKIIGTVRLQGTSVPVPGCFATLAGMGERFNGVHFVSAVRHELEDGNWVTEIRVGMPNAWFVEEHAVESPDAAGLLPGINGLYNATVLKIDADPEGEYRIKVQVPLFNEAGQGLWARLANFYSTSGAGAFFLPEIGDEVILGFLNQDPRHPIIVGSVYSQTNKPFSKFTPNPANSLKGIVSKKTLQILLDDQDTVLTLLTPNNNTVVLDDKNKQIKLADQNGNSIVMSPSGIAIHSDKTISITAGQDVSVKGTTGVSIESSGGDVTAKGVNIQQTAQAAYGAQGNTTVEVQAGASMTLKAGMIMIN